MKKADRAHTVERLIDGPFGKLAVRAKGLGQCRQAMMFVHGAHGNGLETFDFSFPGGNDYSMMDAMVAAGIGALAFDISGYHLSDAPADPMAVDTDWALKELSAAMDWASSEGYERPHLLGFSWGGRIVGRFFEQFPARVDRLVLLDPAFGGGEPVLPAPAEPWYTNTFEFYFDRFEEEFTEPEARKALAELMAKFRTPNGIRLENARGSVPVNPAKLTCPTLMLYGVTAGQGAYMKGAMDRAEFFTTLATDNKQITIIPGGGDYAHVQRCRHKVNAAIIDFLRR